jgi:glycosyltransferase involved in cell wall biosynthesis
MAFLAILIAGEMKPTTQKPCLIFGNYPLRTTDGGPSGFLAQNVAGHTSPYYDLGKNHISFDLVYWWNAPLVSSFWNRVIMQLATLRKLGVRRGGRFAQSYLARYNFKCQGAAKYPLIWFHDVFTMVACLDLIGPRQKIILQSHCPELPSEEEAKLGATSADLAWAQKAERLAFKRANICVFPNEHARRIYDLILTRSNRVEYLMSGCRQMIPRHVLPLDPQYIYFLYIGRRIPVKGFDIVVQAFQRAHGLDPRLRLLVVGGGDLIKSPGLIDVGSSTEPGSWFAACDYLLSINRQSYFDLSVMEALSIGTPLIMACTGGHLYFKDIQSPGIISLPEPDVNHLTESLLHYRRKRHDNLEACARNQDIYRKHFTDAGYRHRLEALLVRLIGENVSETIQKDG